MDEEALIKRAGLVSIIGGCLFAAGWWIFIDGFAWASNVCAGPTVAGAVSQYGWLPLFGVTLSFVMINGMKWSELRDDLGDNSTSAKARLFLMSAMAIAIASMAGSAFIMADKFLKSHDGCQWAGISDFIGTMLILFAAFFMRFGTLPPEG